MNTSTLPTYMYETTLLNNETTTTAEPPGYGTPQWLGFALAGVAIFFFGSNFVPVKKFETGDGMFFQWVLCSAIWHCGVVVHCIRHFPPFEHVAMLGGFLWATGNICVVPIIKTIGLGKGILVWGSVNMLAGWASGRFGWFNTTARPPSHSLLNYGGMGLCLISAVVYLFIRTEISPRVDHSPIVTSVSDEDPLLPKTSDISNVNEEPMVTSYEPSFLERLAPRTRAILGTLMAVASGLLYGLNFTPVIYLMDQKGVHKQDGLDYVFSHFSGIYITSTVYFCLYAIIRRNKPLVYPRAILPAIVSGIMWGIGDCGWFVANDALSEPVSFPIVTAGPAIIGALWGIFFKEITGLRNLLVVGVAICVTVAGSILTGFSR